MSGDRLWRLPVGYLMVAWLGRDTMAKGSDDRAKKTAAKKQELGKALRGMFRRLEDRPVPDRLMSVVDQLEAAAEPKPLKRTGS